MTFEYRLVLYERTRKNYEEPIFILLERNQDIGKKEFVVYKKR